MKLFISSGVKNRLEYSWLGIFELQVYKPDRLELFLTLLNLSVLAILLSYHCNFSSIFLFSFQFTSEFLFFNRLQKRNNFSIRLFFSGLIPQNFALGEPILIILFLFASWCFPCALILICSSYWGRLLFVKNLLYHV